MDGNVLMRFLCAKISSLLSPKRLARKAGSAGGLLYTLVCGFYWGREVKGNNNGVQKANEQFCGRQHALCAFCCGDTNTQEGSLRDGPLRHNDRKKQNPATEPP